MELFRGHVKFTLRTVVETQNDLKEMERAAHEGLSTELFDELTGFIESKGYYVTEIAADLKHVEEAKPYHIDWMEESKEAGIRKVKEIKGEIITTRIEF